MLSEYELIMKVDENTAIGLKQEIISLENHRISIVLLLNSQKAPGCNQNIEINSQKVLTCNQTIEINSQKVLACKQNIEMNSQKVLGCNQNIEINSQKVPKFD